MSRSPALSLLSLGFALLAACSSGSSGGGTNSGSSSGGSTSSGGSGGSGTATIGEPCASSSPCAAGLTCPQGGSLMGRCTADCSSNADLCTTQFGPQTVCMGLSQCALLCEGASSCPGQGVCEPLTSGQSACITNPDGPPGATPLPDGACYNLGGAFGDTIPNGGYRCSVTPTTGAVYGIDQCTNGSWSSAYTCSCSVNGDMATCTDFTASGSAQCEYAFQVCAQCEPGAGCTAQ